MAAPHFVRTPLVATRAIRAERVRCIGLSRDPTPEVHEPESQIVITLGGSFVYHVGRTRHFVDANRVAFVQAGQTTRDSHATGSDVSYLVLTPHAELIADRRLAATALATAELQVAAACFVAVLREAAAIDPLAAEDAHRVGDTWQAPSHPGAPVNSAAWDFGPRLSPDGQLLFFSSNRGFGSEPLSRPLSFDELEQRIRQPRNGLRDIYIVHPRALGL